MNKPEIEKLIKAKYLFPLQHVVKCIISAKQNWIEIEKKVPEIVVMENDNIPDTLNKEDTKNLQSLIEHLIKLIQHNVERMKTNDLQQEQLELAYVIGSLWGQRKVKYYMV